MSSAASQGNTTASRRALVSAALEEYGIEPTRTRLVAVSFNTVVRVTADREYALRIGPPARIHRTGQAEAELGILAGLAEAGVSAPRMFRTTSGEASAVLSADANPLRATLLTWVGGRKLPPVASGAVISQTARLSATLHSRSAATASLPSGVLDGRRPLLFDIPDRLHEVRPDARAAVRRAFHRAQRAIDIIWESAPEHPRIVHGDLTPRNMVRSEGRLIPIDFQDATWAHRSQDIAITLFGLTGGELSREAFGRFHDAYRTVSEWPRLNFDSAQSLLLGRRLMMMNLALHLRLPGWQDYVRQHSERLAREV